MQIVIGEMRIYWVQDRGVHGNGIPMEWVPWEFHGNGNTHIAYNGNENKTAKNLF